MNIVISKDGTEISYLKQGHGLPVILVGGALQTKTDRLFGPLVSLLSKDFTVYTYDRRGRGESGGQTDSIETEVEDLQAVIAAAGGSVFLFGNSSGAQLAFRAAMVASQVSKVAVYEAPFISDLKLGSSVDYEKALRASIEQGEIDRTLRLFFARIGVPRLAVFMMKLMPMWKDLRKLAPSLLSDALLVGDGSVSPEFHAISAEILALTGSSQMMEEAAKKLTEVIPHSRTKILAGQKHAVDPAVLANELRLFFQA